MKQQPFARSLKQAANPTIELTCPGSRVMQLMSHAEENGVRFTSPDGSNQMPALAFRIAPISSA